MTKEDIIKTIVVALIGAFSKSLFDNLLGKYIPDKKKLNSYILKFLAFNLRYTFTMYFLVKAFFETGPVDKFFVFRVCTFITVLFFNLLLDIFNYYTKRQRNHFDRLLTVVERQQDKSEELFRSVEKVTIILENFSEIKNQITDKQNNGS